MSDQPTVSTSAALRLQDVSAGYGRVTVLRHVSLTVTPGSITCVLGPNGAGKTTLLRTIGGEIRAQRGTIEVAGVDVTGTAPHRRCRAGVSSVPEGRGVFPALTVRENLRLGVPPWARGAADYESLMELFPDLAGRLHAPAGSLSGGQQQMVSLARAYLAEPKIVLIDEVSLGLAPKLIDTLYASFATLTESGVALLIVEQYVHRALAVADHVVLLDRGSVAFDGKPDEIDENTLAERYLGGGAESATPERFPRSDAPGSARSASR